MAIPDYQTVMLPLLQFVSDEQEHSLAEATEKLAKTFNLSEAEKIELLPSGKYPIFKSRVGWARTYLIKANILESTRRGFFKITKRGGEVLEEKLQQIDAEFLKQYPEFIEFISSSKTDDVKTEKIETEITS